MSRKLLTMVVFLVGVVSSAQVGRPLSETEMRLQGGWQSFDFGLQQKLYAFWFEGRTFRAEAGSEWYQGRIVLDEKQSPAWFDFVIEDCNCAYKGGTSTGIFQWDGETMLILAPTPGDLRPPFLDLNAGEVIRLVPAEGIDLLLDGRR